MNLKDRRNLEIIGESFNRWYKAEIDAYVERCDLPPEMPMDMLTKHIVRNVSQFTLGRLVTELKSVGVTLEMLIEFLRKNVGS